MSMPRNEVLGQIDHALKEWKALRAKSQYDDCSDVSETEVVAVSTILGDTISRFSPVGSHFRAMFDSAMADAGLNPHRSVIVYPGILIALRKAYENSFLNDVGQLIRGNMFTDFLEMAEHLLEETYKDAAAVIAGGTLEQHLRQLSTKSGLPIPDSKNNKPLKADFLNNELARTGVYQKGEQKSVTAWLDLRNDAAHGNYQAYTDQQVNLMIQGVRDFITRRPA